VTDSCSCWSPRLTAHLAAIVLRSALLAAVWCGSRGYWSCSSFSCVVGPQPHSILRPTAIAVTTPALMIRCGAPTGCAGDQWNPASCTGAGLWTPKQMNDTSQKRIDQHLLTTASVAKAAAIRGGSARRGWTPRSHAICPAPGGVAQAASYRRSLPHDPGCGSDLAVILSADIYCRIRIGAAASPRHSSRLSSMSDSHRSGGFAASLFAILRPACRKRGDRHGGRSLR